MTSRMAAVLRAAALLSFGVVVAAAGLACGTRPSPGGTVSPTASVGEAEVPGAFEDLYAELDEGLSRYAGAVGEAGVGRATAFGAELLAANGNQGPALLRPEAMASVRSNLDQLQRLGVRGVSVQISDPLLMPDFPGSAEYLQFYRRVADEVRRRGLLLLVETGPVFSGTLYSSVEVGGRWPDTKRYFEDRGQQVEIIAREIRPDYLSLGNEPDTERMLTGLVFGLDEYMAFLRATLARVRGTPGVRFGAGTGTWDDSQYVARFVEEPGLDFIDLHVYPLASTAGDYLQRFIDLTRLARARGKDAVVGEAWLYKASAAEVRRRIPYAEVYSRDYYSFWAPLDARFIEVLGQLARREGVAYVSFFWSKYLFGYLGYADELGALAPAELIRRSNRAAAEAMDRGETSPSGEALKRLASESAAPRGR